jgi:hypothetical protein
MPLMTAGSTIILGDSGFGILGYTRCICGATLLLLVLRVGCQSDHGNYSYDPGSSYYGNHPGYGYSSRPKARQTWYYCSDPAGYYPYVTQCKTGWAPVPAG